MKNYLISIGGNSTSNILSIESNFDEIIAVDSGVEHLFKLSLDPNTLIGDLDSISENSLDKVKKNGVDIIAFNSNKDQTDFELALNYLEGVENSIIYIIGGESGEIDHLLSILKEILLELEKNKIEIASSQIEYLYKCLESDEYF